VRVCIPVAAAGGGSASFFRNFRAYLGRAGIACTDDVGGGADVVVVNAWSVPLATVARAKRASSAVRILHRIDGSAVDYGRDFVADVRQALVNALADATIFQSAYGRDATRRRRVILQDGPVIHNPVDVERFRPDGERVPLAGAVRVAHVTSSTNPRKGAAEVYALARRRPDVAFLLVGRYGSPPALPNVRVEGYTDWEQMPALLRSCHVLLILAENEACPNVVLEALASGLPVLYKRSGGTPELVGDCGFAVDAASFDRALEQAMDRRDELARAARRRAVERFAFDVVFPRYLAVADAATRRLRPGPVTYLGTLWRVRPGARALGRWLRVRWRRPARVSGAG
jgi:glycosyltransferase involved in cell wall biosynthesis